VTVGELEDRWAAEYDRLVRLHLADDRELMDRIATCKSGDVIDTLLRERLRRVRVGLYRFALTVGKPRA
jgi:hypothetical protein